MIEWRDTVHRCLFCIQGSGQRPVESIILAKCAISGIQSS